MTLDTILVDGLGTVDAVLVFARIGVNPQVVLVSLLVWRLASILPQVLVGVAALLLWRLSRTGGHRGLGEPWLGRFLHRTWFRLVSSGPWRSRTLRLIFNRVHSNGDAWGYQYDEYEERKAVAAAAATEVLRPRRIVEIGCADGHLAVRLLDTHPQADLTALDIAPAAIEAATRHLERFGVRARAVVGDVGGCPDEGPVDLLVCSEVLYYLGGRAGIRRALAALNRSLTPDAAVLLVHPVADAPLVHGAALQALGMTTVSRQVFDDDRRPVEIAVGRRTCAAPGQG